MDGRSPLHPVEIDEIVARYADGESVRQVASAIGIHRHTVSLHLERRGIARRTLNRSLTDHQCAELAALYIYGMSLTKLGDQYRVHAKTVSNELRKVDVQIRPQGKNHR